MRLKSPHKSWLIALSLTIGLGLTLIATGLASAGQATTAQQSPALNGSTSHGLSQPSNKPASPTPAHRYYVSKSGNGPDGFSWSTAFTQVQDALVVAIGRDEIWVATGVYTAGASNGDSFNLVPGVEIYGGFAATETLREQRDWGANPTVLSGDIAGDDLTDPNGVVTSTAGIVGDNSLHVVYADGAGGTPITGTTVLDGFSITAGQADGGSNPDNNGGGLYCAGSSSGNECSPSLIHLTFSGNMANYNGGAIYNNGRGGASNPSLSQIAFIGNTAGYGGGAIYNDGYGGTSSPSLSDVTFSDNSATFGGGAIFNDGSNLGASSPSLNSLNFIENSASNGGAIYNNGRYGGASNPSLSQITFSSNSAGNSGGAIYNDGSYNGTSSPSLSDMAFSGNSAEYGGGAIYNDGSNNGISSPSLRNVTFSGNAVDTYGGGAILNWGLDGASAPSLSNVTFSGNSSGNAGGAMMNIGVSSPSLSNVTFSGNSADIYGGAMYNSGDTVVDCNPSLVNVILWNNAASSGGAEIYNSSASSVITSSLVQGGITGTRIYNIGGGSVTDGGGNIDGDPLFTRDPDPGDGDWTTLADNDYGDLRLTHGSPAIDAGMNSFVTLPTDLDGNPRIFNDIVDLGAYEFMVRVFLPVVMR